MTQNLDTRIAIIGMTGRFPGARDVSAFWRNLEAGLESIRFFSDAELLDAGVDARVLANPKYVKARGALDDVDLFDAEFFGFTPREAECANPQQRLFLECVWEALEQAGYPPPRGTRSIGVFASGSTNAYWQRFAGSVDRGALSPFQLLIGNDKDYLATRVSYKLNLTGPSVAVQTACSSSLVAVHLACQSLLAGDCDLAIAGGAAVSVPPKGGYLFEEGHINSRDGHCRVFDAEASGVVRGDGVGVVLLKPLDDALADRDFIWGVIAGSAVNNDGGVKVGFTAPGIAGQASVIRAAQAIAGIDPDTIEYVECHGTGTALGDPVEIAALTKAFRAATSRRQYCGVGSVKSNIGHLDVAAGIAGLIKTALSLHHRRIPATLYFTRPNPQIDFESSPFYVARDSAGWPSNSHPRRAAVSSFGIGGTNAHVVLEEAPHIERVRTERRYYVLPVSARTAEALGRQTASYHAYLTGSPRADLEDVAYTLQHGRRDFPHRRALVCDGQALQSGIEQLAVTQTPAAVTDGVERSVVFMFPGQGTQHPDMGRGLYAREPVFRDAVDRCAELSRPHLGLDLRTLLYPDAATVDAARRRLDDTDIAQPALFTVEYALARLWTAWSVRPSAMIGHSIGEYVAACLAGVFTLEDALALVAARGRLMQEMPAGAMLAIPLGEDDALEYLTPELSLAAVNGPARSVMSGTVDAIESLTQTLALRGIEAQRLRTSRAFHSHLLTPMLDRFRREVAAVRLRPPQARYVSNVTGTWIDAAAATDPDYWVRHARQPVRFARGIATLAADAGRVFLEVGPGRALSHAARSQPGIDAGQLHTSLPHVPAPVPDERHILTTLGALWMTGVDLRWPASDEARRVPLPTYPFQRTRHWPDPGVRPHPRGGDESQGSAIDRWLYAPSWRQTPSPPALGSELPPHLASCLVFMDGLGVGEQIVARLRERGAEVMEVVPGPRRQRRSDCCSVDPARPDDYRELIGMLAREARLPRTIVHLWTVAHDQPSEPRALAGNHDDGFHSLVFLAQACGARHVSQPMRVLLVSNDARCVHGTESVRLGPATLLGAARVVSQEYPNLACRGVDVDLAPVTGGVAVAADQILAELGSDGQSAAVAYRGRRRWVEDLTRLRLGSAQRPLRDRGVYLITGGLGRIGRAVAGHLARRCRARLVLTTSAPFPDRAEWPSLAVSATEDRLRARAQGLLAVEQAGGEVLVVHADSADLLQMQDAIERAERAFGALHGVIHAAGATARECRREVQDVTATDTRRQWRPKIDGLLALDAALGDRRLDFRVATSSLASVLGGLGFTAYAAANAFMDAFAHARWQTGERPWTSVNWDGWRFAPAPGPAAPARGGAFEALLPWDQGLEVFEAILTAPTEPQIIVSVADLHERMSRAAAVEPEPRDSPTALAAAPSGAFSTEVERAIAGMWSELLGTAPIGPDDDFFARGGDSLVATRLISRIRELFQVDLPVRMAFEAPSVPAMAQAILRHEHGPGRSEQLAAALNRVHA